MENVFIFLVRPAEEVALCWAMKNVFIFLLGPAEEVTLCWTMKNGQWKMYLFFLVRPAEEVMLCGTMTRPLPADNLRVLPATNENKHCTDKKKEKCPKPIPTGNFIFSARVSQARIKPSLVISNEISIDQNIPAITRL